MEEEGLLGTVAIWGACSPIKVGNSCAAPAHRGHMAVNARPGLLNVIFLEKLKIQLFLWNMISKCCKLIIFLTKNQRPPVCNLFFIESLFLMTSHPLLLLLFHFLPPPPPHHRHHGKNKSGYDGCLLLPRMVLCLFKIWVGPGHMGCVRYVRQNPSSRLSCGRGGGIAIQWVLSLTYARRVSPRDPLDSWAYS